MSVCNIMHSICKLVGNAFILTEIGVTNVPKKKKKMLFFRNLKNNVSTMHTVICHHLSQHCSVPSACPAISPGSADQTLLCGCCERWCVPGGWARPLSGAELQRAGGDHKAGTAGLYGACRLWVGNACSKDSMFCV